MTLTEQQERFCQLIVTGKNQTEAYAEAGYRGKGKQLGDNASRLIANDRVSTRIAELRAKAAEKAVLTTAHFARRLERIAAAAENSALVAAPEGPETLADKNAADVARQCSMDAARLLGLVIDKSERTTTVKKEANAFSRAELYAIARGSGQGNTAPGPGAGKPN